MKRLHIHIAVENLAASTEFYAQLFSAEPDVAKHDYAKWMLEEPRVNFAISARGRPPGLDHLGIQVEDADSLDEVAATLRAAGRAVFTQKDVTCCYAFGSKAWVADPQGIPWETFHTMGGSPIYGEDTISTGELVSPSR